MDAGRLKALTGPLTCSSPCAYSRPLFVNQCQLIKSHNQVRVLVLPNHRRNVAGRSRGRKRSIAVANAAVGHDAEAVALAAATVVRMCWLCLRKSHSSSSSSPPSMPSTSSRAQGVGGHAIRRTVTAPTTKDQLSGDLEDMVLKGWSSGDGEDSNEKRADSWRSASTSEPSAQLDTAGTTGLRTATRLNKTTDTFWLENLEVLTTPDTAILDAEVEDSRSLVPPSHIQVTEPSSFTVKERRSGISVRTGTGEGLGGNGATSSGPTELFVRGPDHTGVSASGDGGFMSNIEAEVEAEVPEVGTRGASIEVKDPNINFSIARPIQVAGASKLIMFDTNVGSDDRLDGKAYTSGAVSAIHAQSLSSSSEVKIYNETLQEVVTEVNGELGHSIAADRVSGQEVIAIPAYIVGAPGIAKTARLEPKVNIMLDIHSQLKSLPGNKTRISSDGRVGAQLPRKKGLGRGGTIYVPSSIAEVLPVDPRKGPEVYLALYETLLGAGRLQDCLTLLEGMNEFTLLNMDKINVFKFYAACKKRRAVKEAFRFCDLFQTNSLRTYNMLLSVCAQAQDADGACRVLDMLERAGVKADCMFYTTLISACAKAGKVDLTFKFLNKMEAESIEANVQTFGAMIDGCARAGDVPKAFGVYGKMLNQNVKPDRVIFNTLINACSRAGVVRRAFDVLADMRAEATPIAPDHITFGALIAACARAGEVERALEVYKRMRSSRVVATAKCYTAAVHACSQKGYLNTALSIFDDMKNDGVQPDEVFFSALIDVAGHAGRIDAAFKILYTEMKIMGVRPGAITYSALMGVCSSVGDSERALAVYKEIRASELRLTVSTFNSLMASLCTISMAQNSGAGKQLQTALTVLQEMRKAGVAPNNNTYSILLEACDKEDQADIALELYSCSKVESLKPTLAMCDSILGLCLRRVQSGVPPPQRLPLIDNVPSDHEEPLYEKWYQIFATMHDPLPHLLSSCSISQSGTGSRAIWGLAVYEDTLSADIMPSMDTLCQLLGCLRIAEKHPGSSPSHKKGLAFNGNFRVPTTLAVEHACGIYHPRALTLFEEATTLGVIPKFDYTAAPTLVDMGTFPTFAGEVGILALLRGLKYRHDAGVNLNSVKLRYMVETKENFTSKGGLKRVQVSGRTGQAVTALLRRLHLKYQGHESTGEIGLTYSAVRNWFILTQAPTPKLPSLQPEVSGFSYSQITKSIADQQRAIRSGQLPSYSPEFDVMSANLDLRGGTSGEPRRSRSSWVWDHLQR